MMHSTPLAACCLALGRLLAHIKGLLLLGIKNLVGSRLACTAYGTAQHSIQCVRACLLEQDSLL